MKLSVRGAYDFSNIKALNRPFCASRIAVWLDVAEDDLR